jgi:hypothetical protein
MPRKAKPRTRVQSCMKDEPSNMSQRTASCHSRAPTSEGVGSLSAPCVVPGGPNRVALGTHSRSDSSCWLFDDSGNPSRSKGTRALPTRNHDGPNTKKSSLGACEPTEDVEPARVGPRKPGRMIRTSYDPSERQRSIITRPKPRSHDNPAISECSEVCFNTSNSNRVNTHSPNKHQ